MGSSTNLEYLVLRAADRRAASDQELGDVLRDAVDSLAAAYERVSIPRHVVDVEVLSGLWRLADLSEQHLDQLRELNHTAAHPIATKAKELRIRGLWAWEHGLVAEAARDFQQAVETDPFDFQSHLHIGHWALLCQDYGTAQEAYRGAARYAHVASDGTGYQSTDVRGELTRSRPEHPSLWEALALVGAARAEQGLGDAGEAVRLASEARDLAPTRFDVVFEIARAASVARLTKTAEESLLEAFSIDPPLAALLVQSEASIEWPEATVAKVIEMSCEASQAVRGLIVEMHSDPDTWELDNQIDEPEVPLGLPSATPTDLLDLPTVWMATKEWHQHARDIAEKVGVLPPSIFADQRSDLDRWVRQSSVGGTFGDALSALARVVLPLSPLLLVAGAVMLILIAVDLASGNEVVAAIVMGGGFLGSILWLFNRSNLRAAALARKAAPNRAIVEWERASGAASYVNDVRYGAVEQLDEISAMPCSGLGGESVSIRRRDAPALIVAQLGHSPEGIHLTARLHQAGAALRRSRLA